MVGIGIAVLSMEMSMSSVSFQPIWLGWANLNITAYVIRLVFCRESNMVFQLKVGKMHLEKSVSSSFNAVQEKE